MDINALTEFANRAMDPRDTMQGVDWDGFLGFFKGESKTDRTRAVKAILKNPERLYTYFSTAQSLLLRSQIAYARGKDDKALELRNGALSVLSGEKMVAEIGGNVTNTAYDFDIRNIFARYMPLREEEWVAFIFGECYRKKLVPESAGYGEPRSWKIKSFECYLRGMQKRVERERAEFAGKGFEAVSLWAEEYAREHSFDDLEVIDQPDCVDAAYLEIDPDLSMLKSHVKGFINLSNANFR